MAAQLTAIPQLSTSEVELRLLLHHAVLMSQLFCYVHFYSAGLLIAANVATPEIILTIILKYDNIEYYKSCRLLKLYLYSNLYEFVAF